MKCKKIKNIILIFFLIIFISTTVEITFQNDTFFTIALGRDILENGINTQEKLVWHENLNFFNPRWAFDVLIAEIYNHFDFTGIYIFVMIVACVQMLLYYHIVNKILKNNFISFLYTIFITYLMRYEFCARGQLISFLIFLIEFYSIEQMLKTNKKIYYVILAILPFILINIHLSVYLFYFLMFVPYIIEFLLAKQKIIDFKDSKFIVQKNNILRLIIPIIVAVVAPFFTPEKTDPYFYMFKTFGGVGSKFISEVQSLTIKYLVPEITMLSLALAVLGFTKTKVKITDCLFILGFFFLSMLISRAHFFFGLISTICIIRIVGDFLKEYNVKLRFKTKKYNILSILLIFTLLTSFIIYKFSYNYKNDYVDEKSYPTLASEYILKNLDVSKMKIYNHFNFGSYLEFKGIKTFLDSRAEVFTQSFNKDCTILEDWYKTITGIIDYKETFEKYGITHAILYKEELISLYIDDDVNWKKIYEDDYFVIYEHIN